MVKSKSEQYLENKNYTPQATTLMKNSVSAFRREKLGEEVEQGLYRDGSGHVSKNGLTSLSHATTSASFKKYANGGSSFFGSPNDSVQQAPEIYSPLWLNSNLNLPRDNATINSWCRSFFALNPFVQNAINLHSTYPISKLNIKCPNKEIEKFFNNMIEEIDLMNICVQIAQEYWLLGEAFVYAELDQTKGKWSRLLIQNPDYMIVNRTVVADDPVIMLRPDENLKKIIFSNRPKDIEQRKQLNGHIIESVKRGGNIPLDNFNVSHLARRISPYENRGTGLPVCIFKQLMLYDRLRESKLAFSESSINPLTLVKIGSADFKPQAADLDAWRNTFECHDDETEVMTKDGFKKFSELMTFEENENKEIRNIQVNSHIEVACFNPENDQLEYHKPTAGHVSNYSGDMYHFKNKKTDIKVTPNHDMWVSKREYKYNGHRSLRKVEWNKYSKVKATDIILGDHRFLSKINWNGKNINSINILNKNVPIELYLEFLGYVISEGCVFSNNKSDHSVGICQTFSKFQLEMQNCILKFAKCINKEVYEYIRPAKLNQQALWSGTIRGKDLYNFFKNEVGDIHGRTKSLNKKIPSYIKELSPKFLQILLDALVKGDGSTYINTKSISNTYCTTSKELADDICEIVYKCGYSPTVSVQNSIKYLNRNNKSYNNRSALYKISWSTFNRGTNPIAYNLNVEKYDGKVWCFTVPTGLFITRRNGRITIQGNSAAGNKDFKIFTHEAVAIEKIIGTPYDISGDITQLIKEIFIGLQVPPVLLEGGDSTTYANGGVALDCLRNRYSSFRNMLSAWLKKKIFAPISEMQDFYDYSGGQKQLIVPEVDWNHMSLFDTDSYMNTLIQLTAGTGDQKRASVTTLYRSLGLEWEDEVRKKRKEAIQAAIEEKEIAALKAMDLNALRALSDSDEITEVEGAENAPASEALPGESGGPGAMPDLSLSAPGGSGPPEAPPAPPPA